MIKTSRLILQPCTAEHLTALIAGNDAFEKVFGLKVMEGYLEFPEVLPMMLEGVQGDLVNNQWGSYLYVHPGDQALIGMGGFKGNPNEEGMVEIGYGVANAYRGQGYATEAARAMIDFAFQDAAVNKVWAHTLAEENASVHVLQKCGMTIIDEFQDPDDGQVWRWQIKR
jgi:[ribosomal protein S5]-alanine N-acetyltransferase